MGRPGSSPLARGLRRPATDRPGPGGGSSPLARGLHPSPGGPVEPPGIIPARAGFTAASTCRPSRPTDHPRSRGVYVVAGLGPDGVVGSSPLARGLRHEVVYRGAVTGIIPARAGFTFMPASAQFTTADHPRSRGVYTALRRARASHTGSSPLARGLLHPQPADGGRPGIIPARAGFTVRAGRPVPG